jgi:hypothetical protein
MGTLSGTVTVITPDGTFPCTVNPGSTDLQTHLQLTCTIGPAEMVTLSGRLNRRTGIGRGKFAESFFKETGTYKSANANQCQRCLGEAQRNARQHLTTK